MSRNRLRNARPKRPFGSEEAATLAAAAITAAATTSGAILQKQATERAAQTQAKALTDNAKTQAEVINTQTTRNAELMNKQIETTNKIHDEDKIAQRDLQRQLVLMQGNKNLEEREEAANIQLAKGGRISGNGLFKITDGGGARLRTITPEGYPVYEFFGNDHKHYHKTKGGKYKSGVGVKLPNGGVVEAEGNQHSSTGELLYVSPKGYDFISDHSLGGITPADLVREGIHPEQAFAYQEAYKEAHRIADDGGKARNGKRCKRLTGGNSLILNDGSNSNMLPNTTAVGGAMFTYLQNQNDIESIKQQSPTNMFQGEQKAKFGKRCKLRNGGRPKFAGGGFDWGSFAGYGSSALLNAGGNLGAYFITSAGNRNALNYLTDAYNERARILAEAYNAMEGIDPSVINSEAYQPAYAMAALESPRFYVGSKLAEAERQAAIERKAINEGSMSSAARLSRLNRSNQRLAATKSAIYDTQANEEGKRSGRNADRLTETARYNMYAASQARRDLANTQFELAKYNNQIANMKLQGIAEAKAGAIGDAAEARAGVAATNAALLGSTIQSVGTDFSTFLKDYTNRRYETDRQYNTMEHSDRVRYLMNNPKAPGSLRKAQIEYDLMNDGLEKEALDKAFGGKLSKNTTPASRVILKNAMNDVDMLYAQQGLTPDMKVPVVSMSESVPRAQTKRNRLASISVVPAESQPANTPATQPIAVIPTAVTPTVVTPTQQNQEYVNGVTSVFDPNDYLNYLKTRKHK